MYQPTEEGLQVPCAQCGAVNRVPAVRVKDDPRCGRCRGKVFPRRPVAVDEGSWAREVERSPLPVLVDFWAGWCAPCQAMSPVLEEVARDRAGRLKVVKVDVDRHPWLAARFGVRSIPTLVLLRGGRVEARFVGAMAREELEARLQALG